jgi:ubiquinone/menaquinone biosynthesis C-methylase UbiE
MTAPDRRHEARLRRGRRTWNLAARAHGGFAERIGAPLHELALRQLELREGEAVLDIGCGAGEMLASIRAAVGPAGRVVGVDDSPRMVARARVAEHGWTNVEVREADASRQSNGHEEFDAAVALSSFSAMPDVITAVRLAHDALRPGGRLFVFDVPLVPSGGLRTRTITRMFRGLYRITTGFTGADVVSELTDTFASVEPVMPPVPGRTRLTIQLATRQHAGVREPMS